MNWVANQFYRGVPGGLVLLVMDTSRLNAPLRYEAVPGWAEPFPHILAVFRLGLALGLCLFVGLEREWRQKDAGLRTFGFAALLGALGGVTGQAYALVSLILVGVLLTLMNWQVIRRGERPELTTSAALIVTC